MAIQIFNLNSHKFNLNSIFYFSSATAIILNKEIFIDELQAKKKKKEAKKRL